MKFFIQLKNLQLLRKFEIFGIFDSHRDFWLYRHFVDEIFGNARFFFVFFKIFAAIFMIFCNFDEIWRNIIENRFFVNVKLTELKMVSLLGPRTHLPPFTL